MSLNGKADKHPHYAITEPGFVCDRHGKLNWAALVDNRRFCPKCVADYLQRAIGEVRSV